MLEPRPAALSATVAWVSRTVPVDWIPAPSPGSNSGVPATLPLTVEPPAGVTVTQIAGTILKDDDVGPMIYRHFLPQALAQGA